MAGVRLPPTLQRTTHSQARGIAPQLMPRSLVYRCGRPVAQQEPKQPQPSRRRRLARGSGPGAHYGRSISTLSLILEIQRRFLQLPSRSFFLLGPRGTGKSTWLRHQQPDALFVDLRRPEVYRDMAARPERLRDLVLGSPDRRTVVVDEVQRVPELLNVVHEILESPDRRQFVLTGSSARKLRRGGIDLLAGRAVLRTLHPFMAAELDDFRLDDALGRGLLPLVIASEHPEDTLRRRGGFRRVWRGRVRGDRGQERRESPPGRPSQPQRLRHGVPGGTVDPPLPRRRSTAHGKYLVRAGGSVPQSPAPRPRAGCLIEALSSSGRFQHPFLRPYARRRRQPEGQARRSVHSASTRNHGGVFSRNDPVKTLAPPGRRE